MNMPDMVERRHKARYETEVFINRHINNQGRGWLRIFHPDGVSVDPVLYDGDLDPLQRLIQIRSQHQVAKSAQKGAEVACRRGLTNA